VSDAGVRGIVLRVHGGDVQQIDPSTIRADAGVTINGLVRWTVGRGVAGLEAWAGTPGTVGGAIYGNAHFKGRLISELIVRVRTVDAEGIIHDVPQREMEFAYDYSRLHRTREIVLSAEFLVSHGEPSRRGSHPSCAPPLANRSHFENARSRLNRRAPDVFFKIRISPATVCQKAFQLQRALSWTARG
ncbi:MAG: FAD-binding protein, partial [Acidobacteria bacterium]|nr:FAD-binding protein [Acidobacteriota bacterium]